MDAAGYHEVVVTRDHDRSLAMLSIGRIKEVIDVYQQRYLELMEKPSVKYISIFHNHGKEAGASMSHPHSQIITTPLIDTDLEKAISNAKTYYRKHKKNIYFLMNEWERKTKKRIVFENKDFLVLCPFASKSAFEIIISPKKPSPHFEMISEKEKESLAEAFKKALFSLYKGLGDPAYNFYLHTAPCGKEEYGYYHWHWTILPKTSIWAGFELGAGMEISTIEPEKAAAYLRKQIS
jgi:UDPglucose--hexose-1-phosphate uridylyltransferase